MTDSLTRAAVRLREAPRRLVEEASSRFDQIARTAAARVTGGRMEIRRRGGRRRLVTLTTATDLRSRPDGYSATVVGVPAGPWVWIEDGTRAHDIGRSSEYLAGPRLSHPVRGPLLHPGGRGRQAWTFAVNILESEYTALADDVIEEALRG